MLLLGKTLVNEDNVLCVSPHYTNPRAVVITTSAMEKIYIDCTEDEFLNAVEDQLGLVSTPHSRLFFTTAELEELYAAAQAGCRFVAKDKTGQVYAYCNPIQKSSAGWYQSLSSDNSPLRMRCEYEALSFDDKHPVDIRTIYDLAER